MKIVILDAYSITQGKLSFDFLKEFGTVISYDRTSDKEIIERVKDCDIVLTNKVVIDKEIIDNSNIKMIQVLATGYNNIDISYANEKGILVCNVPSYSTNSVAQLVFSYILYFANHVNVESKSVFDGKWCNCPDFMYMTTNQMEIANKTLGIIGYGKIGKKIEQIALAFGMNVIINSRTMTDDKKFVSKDELIKKSDFISINCPLTIETKDMVNKDFLSKMKKTAYLINTSRGPVVNENDLKEALNNNVIKGAACDVLSIEPCQPNNPLLEAKNLIITPHLAWATEEARLRLLNIVKFNIEGCIANKIINQIK